MLPCYAVIQYFSWSPMFIGPPSCPPISLSLSLSLIFAHPGTVARAKVGLRLSYFEPELVRLLLQPRHLSLGRLHPILRLRQLSLVLSQHIVGHPQLDILEISLLELPVALLFPDFQDTQQCHRQDQRHREDHLHLHALRDLWAFSVGGGRKRVLDEVWFFYRCHSAASRASMWESESAAVHSRNRHTSVPGATLHGGWLTCASGLDTCSGVLGLSAEERTRPVLFWQTGWPCRPCYGLLTFIKLLSNTPHMKVDKAKYEGIIEICVDRQDRFRVRPRGQNTTSKKQDDVSKSTSTFRTRKYVYFECHVL